MTRLALVKPKPKTVDRCLHGRAKGKCVQCKLDAMKKVIEQMRLIGCMMSNICANLCQDSWTISARERENMKKTYQQWDQISLEGI